MMQRKQHLFQLIILYLSCTSSAAFISQRHAAPYAVHGLFYKIDTPKNEKKNHDTEQSEQQQPQLLSIDDEAPTNDTLSPPELIRKDDRELSSSVSSGEGDDLSYHDNEESNNESTIGSRAPSWVRALSLWPKKEASTRSTTGVQTKVKQTNKQQQISSDNINNATSTAAPPYVAKDEAILDVNNIPVEGLLFSGSTTAKVDDDSSSESTNANRRANNRMLIPKVSLGAILDVGLSNYSKISDGLAPLGSLQKLQNVGDLDSLVKFLQSSIVKESTTDDAVIEKVQVMEEEEFGNWRNLEALVEQEQAASTTTTNADQILFGVSSRLEQILADTTAVFTPSTMSEMVTNVTGVLFASNDSGAGLQAAADRIRVAATKIAKDQGLDMDVAAGQATAITKYTMDLLQFANNVLNEGYLTTTEAVDNYASVDKTPQSQALFDGFDASILERSDPLLVKAGEMAAVSGAIYLPNIMLETLQKYGHALVSNGTTADIAWLVTDSIIYDDYVEGNGTPKLVRTITLRGYDASDANVDRERLVTEVCNATRYPLGNGVDVHIGLMGIAQELYKELAPFIDSTSSSHKIILNGHSIGGSLSNLLVLLLCMDRGAEFVKDRVANVFTFGSPPVAALNEPDHVIFERANGIEGYCGVLDAFGLHGSLVKGFIQPWDPVTRLFSENDALYPLVDDMGEDGLTPWVNGPPRTLRPIVRQLFESLEVWPKMRTNYELTGESKFVFIGTPHLLLPEPSRYLTDRLVSVNLAVPPIDTVLKAEATQIVPMMQKAFPLDEFSISLVSVALRSFIHHFHPAYGIAMEEHVMGNTRKSENALKEAEKDARDSDFIKDVFGLKA